MNVDGVLFISCFLPVVFLLHWLIPAEKVRNYILLAAGLVFCAFGSLGGVVLLTAVAAVNYLAGRLILAGKSPGLLCAAAVTLDLAVLVFFKYLDFLVTGFLGLPSGKLGIAAPLGISFYIFKCISYVVDTRRDREQGTENFGHFLLYISFFPQFTAGPISRFSQFRSQLTARERDPERIARGIRRFVTGLGKKLLIAGILAKVADGVFYAESGILDIRLAWLGAVCYMLQIYFDFSGYSDMAIGLGNAFGFDTPENFLYPYAAVSITDFWRRWHISLSSWFKDYLYIPLGGNRKGKLRAGLNKAVVFLFCGIWHGANWTFLVWGLWHGLFSALESGKVIRPGKNLPARLYTLLVVCLGFVMFRAGSLGQGVEMIRVMFTGFRLTEAGTELLRSLMTGETVFALILGAVLAQPVLPGLKRSSLGQRILEPASWGLCLVLFALCLAKLASGGFMPFIYAQF